jgi:hypothetical protein
MTPARNIAKMIVLTVLCSSGLLSSAQLNFDYTAGKFLIKGHVVDVNTQNPISLANIRIVASGRGLTCGNDGSFVMYVSKKDSLEFSSTGFITKVFSVASLDSSKYYTIEIGLLHDFIKLKEVTIYPFKDVEGFKQAFIDTRDLRKDFMGIAPPKYSSKTPKSKLSNPISYLYDRLKKRGSADPDFKP